MLIAISGSQGSGKTTTLNKLKELGFTTVERKTSRSILNDWGVSLKEVNENAELTLKFQEEITLRKYQDEMEYVSSSEWVFTERTHADLFTYALISLGKDNHHNDWLNTYYQTCKEHNQSYASVFYIRAGHFVPEHDGVRGSNIHYSRMVDLTMLDITTQMINENKLSIIDTPILDKRVSCIRENLPIPPNYNGVYW